MADCFSTAAKAFGLTISIKKTEVLCQAALEPSIKIDGAVLKNVEDFTYLGSCLSSSGDLDTEILSTVQGHQRIWAPMDTSLTQATKLAVYRALVPSTLLYGCETWTCYRRHLIKLDQFHLRRLLGISWEDRVTNQEVLCSSSMPAVEVLIVKAQLRWTGHLMRMEDNRLPRQIFCSELACGIRRQGGQTKRYKDFLKNSRRACDIPGSILQYIVALVGWQPTTEPPHVLEERRLSQLDIKRQARKEAKANPAAAVACPVCGRTCASDFGLRSH